MKRNQMRLSISFAELKKVLHYLTTSFSVLISSFSMNHMCIFAHTMFKIHCWISPPHYIYSLDSVAALVS